MATTLTKDAQIPELEIIKGPGIHDIFDLFLNKYRGFYFKVKIPDKISENLKGILTQLGVDARVQKTVFEIKFIQAIMNNGMEGTLRDFPIELKVLISGANNEPRLAVVKNYDFTLRTGALILGVIE